jgi:HK97 family phage prohead protease
MIRKYLTFPFHTKEVKDGGEFSGHASVFDTIDWYGDVVRKGAFVESLAHWKTQDKLPPILWQHRTDQPLGPHLEMVEDERGLFVRGRLLVDDVAQAREAYALLKNKVISGMSIGFDVPDGGMNYDGKAEVWNITKVNLWENSLVTFPANKDAQVENVKTILASGTLPAPSDFEKFLREAGFTRSAARHIASRGYTSLRDAGLPLRDAEATTKKLDLSVLSNIFTR